MAPLGRVFSNVSSVYGINMKPTPNPHAATQIVLGYLAPWCKDFPKCANRKRNGRKCNGADAI